MVRVLAGTDGDDVTAGTAVAGPGVAGSDALASAGVAAGTGAAAGFGLLPLLVDGVTSVVPERPTSVAGSFSAAACAVCASPRAASAGVRTAASTGLVVVVAFVFVRAVARAVVC